MVALNYEEIKWNLERVPNIEQFINKYKWKWVNSSSKIEDWKIFKNNNPAILYIMEKEIYPVQKLAWIVKKQMILMIPN